MKTASLNTVVHGKLSSIVVAAGVLVGVTSSSWASNIGGRFLGRNDLTDYLFRTESAGVFPQTYWNNIDQGGTTFKGASQSLLDDAGNFTYVKIIYDASDAWISDGGTATPNEKLMKGILKANPNPDCAPIDNSDRIRLTITNLPPTGVYNVVVYSMHNGIGAEMSVGIGATTYYIAQENSFTVVGSFVLATSTTPGGYADANYAQFDNVSPAGNGTIVIDCFKNVTCPQIADGIGVPGIQVVQVSGPAYPPNTSTCAITADPAGTLTVQGNQVTFVVADTGPCKVQWTKNGVNIPGANDETLKFTAALSDNNALIRAIVYNNVNTNVSNPALLQVDANTPPAFTQGLLKVEQWQNIGGAVAAAGLGDLKTNIPGLGVTGTPPTTTYYAGGGNVPTTTPNVDSFGDRIWGWIKPDVTGDYDLFIRSDDSSELYINQTPVAGTTNAIPDVQAEAPVAFEYTCCRAFLEPPSATPTTTSPIHLVAGNYYGIVMLLKEGTGGDMMQLAWRLTTDTTPAANLQPIPAPNVFTMASGAGSRFNVTTQPKSTTVIQGRKTSFTVGVTTTPVPGQFGVQWLSNNVAILGGSGATYTTPPATLGMNGTVYQARVFTPSGSLLSSNATLTVIPDTNAPVPSVGVITRNDGVVEVGVSFDEPVDVSTLVPGNFTVLGASTTTLKLATNSFNTYLGVVLDATGLSGGNTYTTRVTNVKDLFNNTMPQTDVAFKVGPVRWAESGVPIRPGQVVPVGETGFDILNGGRKEWDNYDEITMAYVKKTNDFDVEVQVVFAEPGSQWTRVGLQARNGLDAGVASTNGTGLGAHSAYAQTHVNPSATIGSAGQWPPADPVQPGNNTPNNGHEQNCRLTAGAATTGWGANLAGAPLYPNVWLRLQRVGTNINGFSSSDGQNWAAQGSVTLTDQQADMYVGMSLAIETGNIWPSAGFNVWGPTDPNCTTGCAFDANYDRLWVAQFRNFIDTGSTQISIATVGGVPRITFGGALQRASVVTGPYTDVAGATSPYTVPAGPAAGFFRVRGTITSK
jgi:hypothetical protein